MDPYFIWLDVIKYFRWGELAYKQFIIQV